MKLPRNTYPPFPSSTLFAPLAISPAAPRSRTRARIIHRTLSSASSLSRPPSALRPAFRPLPFTFSLLRCPSDRESSCKVYVRMYVCIRFPGPTDSRLFRLSNARRSGSRSFRASFTDAINIPATMRRRSARTSGELPTLNRDTSSDLANTACVPCTSYRGALGQEG